jgi:tryptophan synthase alpha chain
MGYANPIEAMGLPAFATARRRPGVDGVLVVDYPPEEAAEFAKAMDAHGLAPIFLLAPTTPEPRIAEGRPLRARLRVLRVAQGRDRRVAHRHLGRRAQARRDSQHVTIPVGVGFGIRDPQSALAVAAHADAVVIGSRIIQEIESGPASEAAGARGRVAREHPRRTRSRAPPRRRRVAP